MTLTNEIAQMFLWKSTAHQRMTEHQRQSFSVGGFNVGGFSVGGFNVKEGKGVAHAMLGQPQVATG